MTGGGMMTGTSTQFVSTTDQGITVDPWTLGGNYEGTFQTKVGKTITFVWPSALHGVDRIESSSCPSSFENAEVVGPVSDGGRATYTFNSPGDCWFACPVDGHCDQGMFIHATVS